VNVRVVENKGRLLVNLLNLTWNAKQDQQLFAGMSKVNAGLLSKTDYWTR